MVGHYRPSCPPLTSSRSGSGWTDGFSHAETPESRLIDRRELRKAQTDPGSLDSGGSWAECGTSAEARCLLIGPRAVRLPGGEPVRKLKVQSPCWPTRTADPSPTGPRGDLSGPRPTVTSGTFKKELETFPLWLILLKTEQNERFSSNKTKLNSGFASLLVQRPHTAGRGSC